MLEGVLECVRACTLKGVEYVRMLQGVHPRFSHLGQAQERLDAARGAGCGGEEIALGKEGAKGKGRVNKL